MASREFSEGQSVNDWSESIRRLMDEMHKRTFVQFNRSGTWQPSMNVYENDAAFDVCVDLAGMEQNQVDVHCQDSHRLVISGRRDQPRSVHPGGDCSVHCMEIDEGPFRRELELPRPVDTQQVEAEYRKGYLWIHLPKTTS